MKAQTTVKKAAKTAKAKNSAATGSVKAKAAAAPKGAVKIAGVLSETSQKVLSKISQGTSTKVFSKTSATTIAKAKKTLSKRKATRGEQLKKDLQKSLKVAQAKIEASFRNTIPKAKDKIASLRELLGPVEISKSKIDSMIDMKSMKKQITNAKKNLNKAQKKMGMDQKPSRKVLSIIGLTLLMVGGLLMGKQAMASNIGSQGSSNSGSLNTLGNQSETMQKARPSIPANTYRVVQKRVIERDFRSELGLAVGTVAGGGDSYYQTSNIGVQYDFHLSSRFSIGARYQLNFNKLTPEGKRVYDRAEAMAQANNTNYVVPDLDQPLSTALATVSFYPLYGKVSWFESTVSYFDFYLMAGAGTTSLKNGSSPIGTAGLGMGMWWNQYLTSRLEARYQTYEDQIFTGKRRVEGAVATFTMGLLL